MAELTLLGEVMGLALAAQDSGGKVSKSAEEGGANDLVQTLQSMAEEAAETASRCEELAGTFEGEKAAIVEKARETKQEAVEMMQTYLGGDADALDGFEFLTMAEAGEVGHWEIMDVLARKADASDVQELAHWALPIQQRHLEQARKGSLELAEQEDPNSTQ